MKPVLSHGQNEKGLSSNSFCFYTLLISTSAIAIFLLFIQIVVVTVWYRQPIWSVVQDPAPYYLHRHQFQIEHAEWLRHSQCRRSSHEFRSENLAHFIWNNSPFFSLSICLISEFFWGTCLHCVLRDSAFNGEPKDFFSVFCLFAVHWSSPWSYNSGDNSNEAASKTARVEDQRQCAVMMTQLMCVISFCLSIST